MQRKSIPVVNRLGLHARAAACLVQSAMDFESDIEIGAGDKVANGKSIMSLMMLAAARGATLELTIRGPDEEQAMQSLEALILNRFGESE